MTLMGADTKPRSVALQMPPLNTSYLLSLLLCYNHYDYDSLQGHGKVQGFSADFD